MRWSNFIENLQRKIIYSLYQGAEKHLDDESNEYQELKYLLEVLYENISKFLLTGVIAWLLGILPYFVFFSLIYGSLKYYAYGPHLESSLLCLISGAVVYYGSIYLAISLSTIKLPSYAIPIIFFICFFIYRIYAPAVSKSQFLMETRKKILNRNVQRYIAVLFCVQFLFPQIYRLLTVFALVSQAIFIMPLTFYTFERRKSE